MDEQERPVENPTGPSGATLTAAAGRPGPPAYGPGGRALAPDLARGVMILLIALANVPWYLYGSRHVDHTIHPLGGGPADQVVQAVTMTAVDMRVYPMFAFLLGYGMWQFAASRRARGLPEATVRRMLRRRHLGLLLFGAVHAALLFMGDILGTYGLVGLLLVALFFRRRDRTIAIWSGVLLALGLVYLGLSVFGAWAVAMAGPTTATGSGSGGMTFSGTIAVSGQPDYLASIGERLSAWAFVTPFQLLASPIPLCVLLAFLAARHRVLEEPGRHRRLLTWSAVVGVTIAWAAALPGALAHAGVIGLPVPAAAWWVLMVVQQFTGFFGGLGYVALFALFAERMQRGTGPGPLGRAFASVGRRSLSAYLLQSVVFAPLLCAWGLGLGAHLGSLAAAGLAVLTWILALALCRHWDRTNDRGPAERALRRLTYGRDDPVVPARA